MASRWGFTSKKAEEKAAAFRREFAKRRGQPPLPDLPKRTLPGMARTQRRWNRLWERQRYRPTNPVLAENKSRLQAVLGGKTPDQLTQTDMRLLRDFVISAQPNFIRRARTVMRKVRGTLKTNNEVAGKREQLATYFEHDGIDYWFPNIDNATTRRFVAEGMRESQGAGFRAVALRDPEAAKAKIAELIARDSLYAFFELVRNDVADDALASQAALSVSFYRPQNRETRQGQEDRLHGDIYPTPAAVNTVIEKYIQLLRKQKGAQRSKALSLELLGELEAELGRGLKNSEREQLAARARKLRLKGESWDAIYSRLWREFRPTIRGKQLLLPFPEPRTPKKPVERPAPPAEATPSYPSGVLADASRSNLSPADLDYLTREAGLVIPSLQRRRTKFFARAARVLQNSKGLPDDLRLQTVRGALMEKKRFALPRGHRFKAYETFLRDLQHVRPDLVRELVNPLSEANRFLDGVLDLALAKTRYLNDATTRADYAMGVVRIMVHYGGMQRAGSHYPEHWYRDKSGLIRDHRGLLTHLINALKRHRILIPKDRKTHSWKIDTTLPIVRKFMT